MKIGWSVPTLERERLLQIIPPSFTNVLANVVIWEENVPDGSPPLSEKFGNIVGFTDDEGIQALVIRIGGNIDRPDGEVLHVIWSLDDGFNDQDVIDIFREEGWNKQAPISLKLLPWSQI